MPRDKSGKILDYCFPKQLPEEEKAKQSRTHLTENKLVEKDKVLKQNRMPKPNRKSSTGEKTEVDERKHQPHQKKEQSKAKQIHIPQMVWNTNPQYIRRNIFPFSKFGMALEDEEALPEKIKIFMPKSKDGKVEDYCFMQKKMKYRKGEKSSKVQIQHVDSPGKSEQRVSKSPKSKLQPTEPFKKKTEEPLPDPLPPVQSGQLPHPFKYPKPEKK